MKQSLNVAIAGLGVVGGGVYDILTKELELINKRSRKSINLVAVSSRSKKDFVDESKIKYYENTLDLAEAEDIDVIIETIGGDDVAYELCKRSLKNGKHFITANKAMIAVYGSELADLAARSNVSLCFEAAVAGAIPILKSLKEGLIANKVSKIYGILNGTCNYILTKMEEDNLDFEVALKQAQELGYAEADPTFDIGNIDSAHKLAILSSIAKNSELDFNALHIEGITKISIDDIRFAGEFGYKIKSLGVFEDINENKIKQSVYPALIKKGHEIAAVNDSYNAVLSLGNNAEWNFQVGRGAGAKPTASAVVADILDISNNCSSFPFGCDVKDLKSVTTADITERVGDYYFRFTIDKNFAKDDSFLENLFADSGIISQSIIKEVDEENLIYALKINNIEESA
ncbi:homoserine dehydrogenase, partial [Rickettsiales bacterium]|nr:homoserine dehydrogenase [Rickettsiales bacterium]